MAETPKQLFEDAELCQQQALQNLADTRVYDAQFPPFEMVQQVAAAADASGRPELTLSVLRATQTNRVSHLGTLRQLHETGDPHAHNLAMGLIDEIRHTDYADKKGHPMYGWYLGQGALQEAVDEVTDPEYMRTASFWSASIKHAAQEIAITHAGDSSHALIEQASEAVVQYKHWLYAQPGDQYAEKQSIKGFASYRYHDFCAYILDPTPANRDAIRNSSPYDQHEAHVAVIRRSLKEDDEFPEAQLGMIREAINDPAAAKPGNNVLRDLLRSCLDAKRYDLAHEFFIDNEEIRERGLVGYDGYVAMLLNAIARNNTARIDGLLRPSSGELYVQLEAARKAMENAAYDGDKEMIALLGKKLKQLSAEMIPWYHHGKRYGGREHAINEGLADIAWGDFDVALQRAERPRRRRELLYAHFLPYIIGRYGDPHNHLQLADQKITTPDVYFETYERIAEMTPDGQFNSVKTHIKHNLSGSRKALAQLALSERLADVHMQQGEWQEALESTDRIPDDKKRATTLLHLILAAEKAKTTQ